MTNGVDILVDRNIFIYWLQGSREAADILSENNIYYSIITEIEVKEHTSLLDTESKAKLSRLFNRFTRVGLTEEVKDLAIQYKVAYKLKTPDAFICGSSRVLKIPLLTVDKKILSVDKIITVLFTPL